MALCYHHLKNLQTHIDLDFFLVRVNKQAVGVLLDCRRTELWNGFL